MSIAFKKSTDNYFSRFLKIWNFGFFGVGLSFWIRFLITILDCKFITFQAVVSFNCFRFKSFFIWKSIKNTTKMGRRNKKEFRNDKGFIFFRNILEIMDPLNYGRIN